MFMPRVRKVRLKRVLDSSFLRWVPDHAAAIVATSRHESEQLVAAGAPADRVVVRGNGFPAPVPGSARTGALRRAIGIGDEQLILYVGRIASGKGIDLLLDTVRAIDGVHLALVGPDDGHGVAETVAAAERDPALAGRVHRLQPATRPLDLYGDADVFVLPSSGESFGMVAAEAAAAGTPVIVSDRCGVAEALAPNGALVVPYDGTAVRDAVTRVLRDPGLRARLSSGGREVAAALSWDVMVERQEHIYRTTLSGAG
jgi:glycosyltransferase involved in cell wall biosynthesis